jgi:hypothetical protein
MTIDAKGYAKRGYTWNGLLGLGILQAGYDVELFAGAKGDLAFRGAYLVCGGRPGGKVKFCAEAVNLTIGAKGSVWGQVTPAFQITASIASSLTCPVKFCANLDIGTGTFSNVQFETAGACTGNVTVSAHVVKPGEDIHMSTCILGNCPVVISPPPHVPGPPQLLF